MKIKLYKNISLFLILSGSTLIAMDTEKQLVMGKGKQRIQDSSYDSLEDLMKKEKKEKLYIDVESEDKPSRKDNYTPVMSRNPLTWAEIGQTDAFERVVRYNQKGMVNYIDNNKCTPLHVAAGTGHLDTVMFLIENGAEINAQNNEHETPLCEALKLGYWNVAKYLLDNKANPNIGNIKPLQLAVMMGTDEWVEGLLENGAEVDTASAIVVLCDSKAPLLNKLFNLKKLDPNKFIDEKKGQRLIHYAAEYAGVKTMLELIDAQANLNHVSSKGYPLHITLQKRNKSLSMLLINNKAKLDSMMFNGQYPIHYIIDFLPDDREELFNTMLKMGGSVNIQDSKGNGPLHALLGVPYIRDANPISPMIISLLRRNAAIDTLNKEGKSPLHLMVHNTSVNLIAAMAYIYPHISIPQASTLWASFQGKAVLEGAEKINLVSKNPLTVKKEEVMLKGECLNWVVEQHKINEKLYREKLGRTVQPNSIVANIAKIMGWSEKQEEKPLEMGTL